MKTMNCTIFPFACLALALTAFQGPAQSTCESYISITLAGSVGRRSALALTELNQLPSIRR